jgi:hypothetical protein
MKVFECQSRSPEDTVVISKEIVLKTQRYRVHSLIVSWLVDMISEPASSSPVKECTVDLKTGLPSDACPKILGSKSGDSVVCA